MTDITGREAIRMQRPPNISEMMISLEEFDPGLYLISVQDGTRILTGKLMIK